MPRPTWRRAAFAAAFALSLALPAAASAADDSSISLSAGVVTITATAGQDDVVYYEQETTAGNPVTFRTRGSTYPNLSAGCAFVDDNFYKRFRCDGPITKVVVNTLDGDDTIANYSGGTTFFSLEEHGGDGRDQLYGGDLDDQLFGDDGNDYAVFGGPGNDVLEGGAGTDSIYGAEGNDTLRGGDDRDDLIGGPGADDIDGGLGFDLGDYSDKSQPVTVTLDDQANDGEGGEGDNVRSTVEDVLGGSSNDSITGSAVGNEIDGGPGNDLIDGGAGTDRLTGNLGNDTILSRDGNPERIDCGTDFGGADTDSATTDTIDEVSGCEANDASSAVQGDKDGDGFSLPQDCNDTNGAINPGAADTPDDGIDQNCDGKDAVNLDADKDGFNKDVDCDDRNAAVHPGATEVIGNEVDENCDGFAPPTPVIETPVNIDFPFHLGVTRVNALGVGELVAGTTVIVRCTGGKRFGCPVKSIKKTVAKASKGISFLKKFRNAKLRRGATIEVEITKPGFVGRLVRLKIKPKGAPTPRPLCIYPGDTKAKEC